MTKSVILDFLRRVGDMFWTHPGLRRAAALALRVPVGVWLVLLVVGAILGWRHYYLSSEWDKYSRAMEEIAGVTEYSLPPVANQAGTTVCYARVEASSVGFYQQNLKNGQTRPLLKMSAIDYESELYELLGWSPEDMYFAYTRRAGASGSAKEKNVKGKGGITNSPAITNGTSPGNAILVNRPGQTNTPAPASAKVIPPKPTQEIVICSGDLRNVRKVIPVQGKLAEFTWLGLDALAYVTEAWEAHYVQEQADGEWREVKKYRLGKTQHKILPSMTRYDGGTFRAGNNLPSPWETRDIGSVGVVGSARYSNGVFMAKGAGTNIMIPENGFRFVFQRIDGDGEITARVTSLDNTHEWAKAGLMMRENFNKEARQVSLTLTPGHGVVFQTARKYLGTNQLETTAKPWVKLIRKGTNFLAFCSTNGLDWQALGKATLPMTNSVYWGLAVCSHANTKLANATFDQVKVTGLTAPAVGSPALAGSGTTNVLPQKSATIAWQDGGTIWAMDLATGKRGMVAAVADQNLEWLNYSSQSGKFIYCVGKDKGRVVCTFDPKAPGIRPKLLNQPNEVAYNGRWMADGRGYAYVGFGGLMILKNPEAEPVRPFAGGAVRSYRVAPGGERLYAVAAQAGEPMGLWEYDLVKDKKRCLAPAMTRPFRYARMMKSVRGIAPLPEGGQVPFFIVPPAHFDRSKKYPMVIDGPSQERWAAYSQTLANADVYYVSVDRFSLASADRLEGAMEDILAVYDFMIKRPQVDASRVYISAFSRATVTMNQVLQRKPEIWKGAMVMNPGVLPTLPGQTADQPRPAHFPEVMVSAGDSERGIIPRLEKYEQSACEAGVYTWLNLHESAGHQFRSSRLILERSKLVVDFVSRK